MNKKDKQEMKGEIIALRDSRFHSKYSMAKELINFLNNVDRGKHKKFA